MTSQHWKFKNKREWTEDEITQLIIDEVGKDIVRPTGFNLLVKLCKLPEKTAAGLIIPEIMEDQKIFYSRVARVLDMGPYAYNSEKFPLGPFCYIGDYINFPQYNWEKCPIKDANLYYIACNQVSGVVPNPDGILI